MFNQNTSGIGNDSVRGVENNNHIDTLTTNDSINNRIQGSSHNQQQQNEHNNTNSNTTRNIRRKAFVKIIEQPASKALRFRYECEGRSAGSIPGVNSTPENKTFPSIEIVGYKGRAVVVVSCVTKDPPYRPHPHNLVGKEGCKKGVCTLEIDTETMKKVFSNLGIQCVKKKDIESALRAREEIRVDPFKTGFQHRFQPSSIDLNSVRLCFQVFLESEHKGKFTVPLPPVVSDPIYDKKAMSDLVICTLCSCSSTVAGGKEIILLCEKVAKEDISVRFFEEQDGQIVWEGFGDFQHTDVHKQTAIKFKTPRYKTMEIDQPVKVNVQLRRPSDGATSEPLPFDYLPLDSDPAVLKRKRQKFGGEPSMHLFRNFQAQEQHKNQDNNNAQAIKIDTGKQQQPMDFLSLAQATAIKAEPRDVSPLPCNFYGQNASYRLPENSPSPQPISPSNIYSNINNNNNISASNTPSPYSMYHAGGGPIISPNHQHQYGGGNLSPNMNMDMMEFTTATRQQQQHQQDFVNIDGYHNQFRSIQQLWNLPQESSPMEQKNDFNINNLIEDNNTNLLPIGQHHNDTRQTQNNWNLTLLTSLNKQEQHDDPQLQSVMNNLNSGNFNVNQILANVQVQNQSQLQEAGPNLSSLLDMDSEQLIQFNSAELSGLSLS